MVKLFQVLIKIAVHFAAGICLFWAVTPFAKWYLFSKPAVGVDLYNSATYVAYHLRHFSLPWNGFKDIWYAGYPLMQDFPQLGFYLMLPAGMLYGPVMGVQITAVAFLLLLLFCSYLLYYQLSKNWGLSLLLSLLVFLSVNIYGALTWAGSVPSFMSQLFFPLGLLFAVRYFESHKIKELALLTLISAIGILVHPLEIVAFVVPSACVLVLAAELRHKTKLIQIPFRLLFYICGFFFGSFIFTQDIFMSLIRQRIVPGILETSKSGTAAVVDEGARQIAQFYKDQVQSLVTHTHPGLFVAFAVGLIVALAGIVIAKKRSKILILLPLLVIASYTALHPIANFFNIINIFRHDPYRAFWPFPIALGAVAAAGVGFVLQSISERLESIKIGKKLAMGHVVGVVVTVLCLGIGFTVNQTSVTYIISQISARTELSSAFPEALSIDTNWENLKKVSAQAMPSFMKSDEKNKRLYAQDQALNIWWNTFNEHPISRGYIDPPIGTDRRGGLFWMDIAIANDTIVRDFKISEEQAFNNSLYLIDWNSVYYFEGGRLNSKGSSAPPSSYLLSRNVFSKEEEVKTQGVLLKWQTESGKPELHMELEQSLKFFQVDEKYTSPIATATNATPVMVIGSFGGFEDIMRLLGATNLNSQRLIPVRSEKRIEEHSIAELKKFDLVILHEYRYQNKRKAFALLEEYVKGGGKIFIETGTEVPEASSSELPEIFPFATSIRGPAGDVWELGADEDVVKDLNLDVFGPPKFNDTDWNIAHPDGELREGDVLLTHEDIPIIVERSLGEGRLIWSGMNLPYHFNQYHVQEEAELFKILLGRLVSLPDTGVVASNVDWIRPGKITISSSQARGMLLKQQGYAGWNTKLTSDRNKRLDWYVAGPTFPGYIYVPLPENAQANPKVTFTFNGRLQHWIATGVNLLVILVLLELILFKRGPMRKVLGTSQKVLGKGVGKWWEKDEDE